MDVSRRVFLGGALSLPAIAWAGCGGDAEPPAPREASAPDLTDWGDVRGLFDLDPGVNHLAAFILAPHSKPVRDAIATHRDGLDRDPRRYYEENRDREELVAGAAAKHLKTSAGLIALTDSTTMGLGLLYGGLELGDDDEVLTTEHDHYATHQSLELAGARMRKVRLYPQRAPERATVQGILDALGDGVTRRTKVVAITWVHSSSGIRLPIREIADLLKKRDVLLVVDAAHALGTGPIDLEDLGADAFVAGCHKWLLGPRGTGVAWASERTWERVDATIPTFSRGTTPGSFFTPGGYHSFEHRWALEEAFALQDRIGPQRIGARITELADALRDGLAGIRGVRLHSPRETALHSGVVTCSVGDRKAADVVEALGRRNVIASTTPYTVELVRFGTLPITTPAEVDATVRAVAELA